MSDELPEELPIVDEHLEHNRTTSNERFIASLNAASSVLLQQYPRGEIETWTIQKNEAEAFLAAETKSLDLAPFITNVCIAQFGEATEAERLAQLEEKCLTVKALSDAFLSYAAFANGLRARVQLQFEAATTSDEVVTILKMATTELEDFRRAAGF